MSVEENRNCSCNCNCECEKENTVDCDLRREMIQEIRCCEFAITELALYLDTHPDDQKALCLHRKYCKQMEMVRRTLALGKGELLMWTYNKTLQYPINIKCPDPRLAKVIISQYGGPDGELAASLRYLSQRFGMPDQKAKAILNDIGTEEYVPKRLSIKYNETGTLSRVSVSICCFTL